MIPDLLRRGILVTYHESVKTDVAPQIHEFWFGFDLRLGIAGHQGVVECGERIVAVSGDLIGLRGGKPNIGLILGQILQSRQSLQQFSSRILSLIKARFISQENQSLLLKVQSNRMLCSHFSW